jgi:hypothetical protein
LEDYSSLPKLPDPSLRETIAKKVQGTTAKIAEWSRAEQAIR